MPIFKVNIDREVVEYDRFTRFIEADSAEAAHVIAADLADEANHDCPDDAGTANFDSDLGDWFVNDVAEATEEDLEVATEAELEQLEGVDA